MLNKYVILALAILATYPIGRLARTRPSLQWLVALMIGFLPFVGIDQLNIDLWGVAYYRGESKGFEVTAVDLAAATLYFSLPDERVGRIPYRFPRWFYLAAVVFSIGAAVVPLYSWFSLWKLVRAYFLFAVVFRAVQMDGRVASWMSDGFGVGILYSLAIGLHQRYVLGAHQVTGDFDHQNSLGMAVNLVFPIVWAVVLAGQARLWGSIVAVAAAVAVVMTLSRGSLAFFALAVVVVLAGSFLRGVTKWKLFVLAIMVVIGGVVAFKSWDSIVERFLEAPEESVQTREKMEAASAAMLADQPLGIGMNQYSYVLDHEGYADRAGLTVANRDGVAHHIYWLTLAEMGYVGLAAFLLLILAPVWTSVKGIWRIRGDVRGDVMLGALAGMAAMHLHGLYEWIARQTPMSQLLFSVAGITAGLYAQWLAEERVGRAIEEAARAAVDRERPRDRPRVELGVSPRRRVAERRSAI